MAPDRAHGELARVGRGCDHPMHGKAVPPERLCQRPGSASGDVTPRVQGVDSTRSGDLPGPALWGHVVTYCVAVCPPAASISLLMAHTFDRFARIAPS